MNIILAYILSFIAVITISLSGQYFTSKNIKTPWYECIKSNITPPGWVFPIVWTLLYIFIAIALARTLLNTTLSTNVNITLFLFILNLLLNVTWCYAFFYKQNPNMALIQMLFLILSASLIIYITQDKIVKYLMVPYVIWLGFATILNILSIGKQC
jgi:tryptophan-rich sensory protein